MGREVVTSRDAAAAKDRFIESLRQGGVPGGKPAGADKALAKQPDGRQATLTQIEPDRPVDRLLKYIPAEVVGAYVALQGVVATIAAENDRNRLLWLVFVVLLPMTWFYLARVQHVKKTVQLMVSSLAFAVWVFSLGGPFASLQWYHPVYGAILLPLYTIAVA